MLHGTVDFVGERSLPAVWLHPSGLPYYLQMSDVLVLAPYRGNEWVQRLLITAVINTFTGYLPPSFFHDIFGPVIPLNDRPRKQSDAAHARRMWKDNFVKVIPDALKWSGLLCVDIVIQRYQWWSEAGFGFEKDLDTGEWDPHDGSPDPHILMLRRFEKVREIMTSPEVNLRRLHENQQKAFNFEHTHVRGTDWLTQRAREAPLQDKEEPEAEPEHEG